MSVGTAERVFTLPDLGEGLTEAEVVEWKVAVGDAVTVDQVVVVVETAKATVELPCPYAGRVVTLYGTEGQTLDVGKPLISIASGAPGAVDAPDAINEGDEPAAHAPPRGTARAGARPGGEEPAGAQGSGAVLIGYGTAASSTRRRRRVAATAPGAEPDSVPAPAAPAPADRGAAIPVISPIVRKLARDNGIELAVLAAQRGGAVIRRRDVEAAMSASANRRTTGSELSPGPARLATAAPAPLDEGATRIPLRGVRRVIADKLARSRREIPDATTWVDVDATGLLAARDAIRAADPEAGIGLLALLARICVAGLARFPELNARVDTEREEIVQLAQVNLGFATQTPRGLVVPVVHGAQAMTSAELASELRRLTEAARDGLLTPAQMSGGTFTLNNYGVFGVDGSTPIINHPEAAMLGVGRIIDKPWAHEGQLALRKVTQLSFSFDHRVCDGGTAGGFLRYVADCVESPMTLLAHL